MVLNDTYTRTDILGNDWTIAPSKVYPGLFEVTCTNKPNVKASRVMQGYFTGKDKALAALNAHVSALQAKADQAAKPLAKKG
jgi:hypothetical protein